MPPLPPLTWISSIFESLRVTISESSVKSSLKFAGEAKNILKEANKKIESTIREIKEGKADKELTKLLREDLVDFEKKELVVEKPKLINKEPIIKKESGEIKVGDLVRIKGQTTLGTVGALKGKDAEIIIGELKSNVKLVRLEKVSKKEFKEVLKEAAKENLKGFNINERMSQFSFNLDIRGKRGEEALGLVDNLMDDAILLGYPQLRIVHGKGDGILRNLIRNHLKLYSQIKSVADEHADRGGQGVTLIEMK